MKRYSFEFISLYRGIADYRIYVDGKSDTRISVENNVARYCDGSGLLKAELSAFNDFKRSEFEMAIEKCGKETMTELYPNGFRPITTIVESLP